MKFLKRFEFHPFLFAIYPILSLLANNLVRMTVWEAARSLLVSLLATGLLLLLLRLAFRDWFKASLLASLALLLFFTYGHVHSLLENMQLFGLNIGRHRNLIIFYLGLLALATWWLRRRKESLAEFNQVLNGLALFLMLFPIFGIVRFETRRPALEARASTENTTGAGPAAAITALHPPAGQTPPDVYYIILDAYGRDDTLKDFFDYDNLPFVKSLEQAGFYVARCSQSNYSKTQISLASSLNMDYLSAFGLNEGSVVEETSLNLLIHNNAVRRSLKQLGYKIVVVESGFSPTEWAGVDVYLASYHTAGLGMKLTEGINPFEALLLRTSAGLLFYEFKPFLPYQAQTFLDTAYTEHRTRILYALDELPKIPAIAGPKLVFAHILAPHEPFVLGPNGEMVSRRTPFTLNNDQEYSDSSVYQKGYRDQVNYLNTRIGKIVREMLEASPTPPVIILQGDHGPLMRVSSKSARLTILNAYYFPEDGKKQLYSAISPVNTFRAVFNRYFNAGLPLLEDKSYYYDNGNKQFVVLPNERTGCEEMNP